MRNGKDRRYYLKHHTKILKRQSDYYQKNKKARQAASRLWSKAHPRNKSTGRVRDLAKERVYNRKTKYGISENQFQKMLVDQKNLCFICNQKETMIDKKSGKVKQLCVDHDHKTNEIRKLLCWRCNLGIGVFGDDAKLLQTASEYLKRMKGN